MSIPTSCLPREINLGDRRVRIDPPTVRQAVEIIHVLDNLEDEHDVRLLFELLKGLNWHGAVDILVHLRNQMNNEPIKFSLLLRDILFQGYSPKEQTEKSKDPEEKEEDSKERKPEWDRLISKYCTAFPGEGAYQVYNEVPFPFFMEMLPEARRKEAVDHINRAFEASFAMGGSEKMMDRWQEQAGFKEKKEKERANKYQEEVPKEELKKDRKSFKQDLMQ